MYTYFKYLNIYLFYFFFLFRLVQRKKKLGKFFEKAAEEAGGPNCNLSSFLITPVQVNFSYISIIMVCV